MQSISMTHPLQILIDLENACNAEAITPVIASSWIGLGFSISSHKLCVSSPYIDEVLDSNFRINLSKVPGAKKWLRGLISLRGQALPVIDLNQYLLDTHSELTKKSRLLVIKFNNMKTGLIVDEVYGLKRFDLKDVQESFILNALPNGIKNFSEQTFHSNNEFWIEFSIQKLEKDPNFLSAARF